MPSRNINYAEGNTELNPSMTGSESSSLVGNRVGGETDLIILQVFPLHGLPIDIISGWCHEIFSRFWKLFFLILMARLKGSTRICLRPYAVSKSSKLVLAEYAHNPLPSLQQQECLPLSVGWFTNLHCFLSRSTTLCVAVSLSGDRPEML